MPFQSPFKFPYFFRPPNRFSYWSNTPQKTVPYKEIKKEDSSSETKNCSNESSEYFFEVFGLKLYYDDILIMCLLYFLYTEGIQDQELFICLILLLLS